MVITGFRRGVAFTPPWLSEFCHEGGIVLIVQWEKRVVKIIAFLSREVKAHDDDIGKKFECNFEVEHVEKIELFRCLVLDDY